MIDTKDLEEYWRDLRIGKVEITPEAEGPESIIERATLRAQDELEVFIADLKLPADFRDPKNMGALITGCFRILAMALYEEQKKQDVSLLIQLFLEGTANLAADEIKGFLRAIPRVTVNSLLSRMGNSRSGLHALLSLEALFRDRSLERDYEIRRDHEGKLVVTFYPKEVPEAVSFRLRELFESQT